MSYTIKDIQRILGISRTMAYRLVQAPPFVVLKIGKSIRIPKASFDQWMNGEL